MARVLHLIKHVAGKLWTGKSLPALPCMEELLAQPARETGGVAACPGSVPAGSQALADCPPQLEVADGEQWHGRMNA